MNLRRILLPWCAAQALCWIAVQQAGAQHFLDELDDSLFVESSNGMFRSDLSALWDLQAYYIDQRPPALLVSNDELLFNPRLAFFVDTVVGEHFYSLVQVRVDGGFDAGTSESPDVRADEYLLRYSPFSDDRLRMQAGKFATVVGNWVARHDSWHNPFVNAPLPYENLTTVSDRSLPADSGGLVARRDLADNKFTWMPVVWGPSYGTGFSVSGLVRWFEYALEIKNTALSSRPGEWDGFDRGLGNPTWSARLGFRPNAAWRLGTSFSTGPYLNEKAKVLVPPGTDIDDFDQTTLAVDGAWSWRHWEVWAELFLSRFEVPNAGDADTLAYYLEARYGLTPDWALAGRWNQQLFDEKADSSGGRGNWDRDTWRVDAAVTRQFGRHWQLRIQYSYTLKDGPLQQGEQAPSLQLTLKF